MKTLLLISLFLCRIAATAQSEVQTTSFKASILPVTNGSKIHVVVNKEFGKNFFICLRDTQHTLLYFGEMKKRSVQYRFVIDLKELAEGKYYMELSDGKTPVVTKILLKEQSVLAKPIVTNQIVFLN